MIIIRHQAPTDYGGQIYRSDVFPKVCNAVVVIFSGVFTLSSCKITTFLRIECKKM